MNPTVRQQFADLKAERRIARSCDTINTSRRYRTTKNKALAALRRTPRTTRLSSQLSFVPLDENSNCRVSNAPQRESPGFNNSKHA